MSKTYAAPTATSAGDVIRTTLGVKPFGAEPIRLPSGGSNLSFGL